MFCEVLFDEARATPPAPYPQTHTAVASLGGYHPFDPFGTATEQELQDSVRALRYDFKDEAWDRVSSTAKDFIACMLKLNPKERPSARRLAQVHHPRPSCNSRSVAGVDSFHVLPPD